MSKNVEVKVDLDEAAIKEFIADAFEEFVATEGVEYECPECGEQIQLRTGINTCESCGFTIEVKTESPQL